MRAPYPNRVQSPPDAGMAHMSRILLVRHGQSTWNADGRWQGQADPPLSPLGVEQAETAARVLERVDAVWSSDLERANHTARILSVPHALAVTADARMREREAGPWTGLTRDEIEARFPGHLADGRRPPGYEDDESVATRALAALRDLAVHLDGGTGVVVTHGGVILTIERYHGIARSPIHNLEARWIEVAGPESATGFAVGDRVTLL
jgi:broad specificity phosphatase PhoE